MAQLVHGFLDYPLNAIIQSCNIFVGRVQDTDMRQLQVQLLATNPHLAWNQSRNSWNVKVFCQEVHTTM